LPKVISPVVVNPPKVGEVLADIFAAVILLSAISAAEIAPPAMFAASTALLPNKFADIFLIAIYLFLF